MNFEVGTTPATAASKRRSHRLILVGAIVAVVFLVCCAIWNGAGSMQVSPIVASVFGWLVATGTSVGIAFFILWFNDWREVDRSRRAIRRNFDHAILALLKLAQAVVARDRPAIGANVESAQRQLIAASARLKRFEGKLAAFPPATLNAYGDLENEIDATLEDLNELHRRARNEPDTALTKIAFEVTDRLARFDEFLAQIHPDETETAEVARRWTAEQRFVEVREPTVESYVAKRA